jgi:hypothetical protein
VPPTGARMLLNSHHDGMARRTGSIVQYHTVGHRTMVALAGPCCAKWAHISEMNHSMMILKFITA